MPRNKNNQSKTREWERERRERLNDSFTHLGVLLPDYDPCVTTAKVDILTKAARYIRVLQQENQNLLNGGLDQSNLCQMKLLKHRVDELVKRTQQLSTLLRDAGITIPVVTGSIAASKPNHWDNKIRPEEVDVLMERVKNRRAEARKLKAETLKKKADRAQPAKTRRSTNLARKRPLLNTSNLPSTQSKPLARSINKNVKRTRKKATKMKNIREKPTVSQMLGLTLKDIEIPNLEPSPQHFIVINHSSSLTSSVVKPSPCFVMANMLNQVVSKPHLLSAPIMASRVQTSATIINQNPSIARLGPGTLILANGNIVPVNPQSQTVLTPLLMNNPNITTQNKPVFMVNNNVVTTGSNFNVPVNNSQVLSTGNSVNPGGNSPTKGHKYLTKLIPKPHRRDTTSTTNSNKVPIPSLTSRLCLDSLDKPLGKVVPIPRAKKKVNVKRKTGVVTKKPVQVAVNVEKTTVNLDQSGGQKGVAESVNDTVNVDKPVQCGDEKERTLLLNNTVLDEISNNISVSVSNDDKTKRIIPIDKETIVILGKRKCDDVDVEKVVETKQLKLDETVKSKENKVLITNKSKDDEPIKYISNTVTKISNSGSYTIDALCKLKTTVERIGKDDRVSTEYGNEEKMKVSDSNSQKVDVPVSLLDRPITKILPEKKNSSMSLRNENKVIVLQEKQNVPTSTCQTPSTFGNQIPPKIIDSNLSKLPMSSCKSISSEIKSVERIETAISIGSTGSNCENVSTKILSAIDGEKTKTFQSSSLFTPVIYSCDITKTTPSVKLVATESTVLKSATTVTKAPTRDIETLKTSTSNLDVEPNYSQSKLFESTSYSTDIFSKSNSVLASPTRENETTFSETLLPIIANRPIYSQSKTFVPLSYTSNAISKSTELPTPDVSTAKTFTTVESVTNDYIFVPSSSTIAQTPTVESRTIFSSIGQDNLSVYPQTKIELETVSTKTFMALGSDKPTFSQSKVFHSTSFTNDNIFPKSTTIAQQIPMRDISVTKTSLSTESNKSSYSQNKTFVSPSFTNDNIFFKSATTVSSQAMETTKSYVSIANDKPTYSQSKPFAPTSFPNENIFLKATTASQVPTRETETAKVFVTSDKPTYSQSKVFVPTSFSNDNIFLKSSSTMGLSEMPAQETETSKTFVSIDSSKPTYSQTKVFVPTSFSSDNIFLKTSSSIPTSLHYFPPITAANAFNSIPHSDANTFVPISNDLLNAKSYENDSVNVHSSLSLAIQNHEFSNDIFASLQVPSGGQHPESISPTAAFLLAFPLVSTSKVTELIDAQDEAGSDSLQGTSTLLQIGNIDSESNIVSCIPRSSSNQTKDTRFAVKNSESEKMVSVQTSGMIEQGIFSDCVPNKSLNSKTNIFEFDNSGYSSMIPPISDSFLPAIGSITKFEAKLKSNQFDSTKGASHVCDNSQKLGDFVPNKFMDFSLVQNHNVGVTPCSNMTLKQPTQNSNPFQTFNKDNPFMTHMSAANPLSDMPIPKSIHQQTCTKFNVTHSVNNQLTELPSNNNYKSGHKMGSSTEPSTYCGKATDVGNAPQVKTSIYSRPTNDNAQPYNYNLFDMPVITSSANNYPQVIAGNEKSSVTFPVHSSASILPWTTSSMTLPRNANQFDNFNNIHVENVEKSKVATSSVGTLPSIHEIYGNKGGRADEKPATFQNIFPNTIDERQINFADNSGQNMTQDSRGNFKYQTDIKTNQSNPMFSSKSQHNNHRPPVNWMTTPDNRQQIFTSAPNQNLATNTVTSTSMITESSHKEFDICPNQNIFSSNNSVPTPNFDSRNFNSAPFYGNNFYPPNSSGISCPNDQNQEQIQSSQRIPDVSDHLNESYSLNWNTSPRKVPFGSSAIPEINNVFVPSTLPTLVGDLALGTNFVMNLDEHNLNKTCQQNNYAVDKAAEQRRDAKPKMEKEPVKSRGKITQDYQASGNFLSVSQLVDPQKSGVITRSPPRRNNRNVANKQNLQRQNAPKRLSEDSRKAQIQDNVPKFKRDVDRVGSFVAESLPPNSQSYQTNTQWTNTKQTRTNYKAPVSNYSAEALIGLTNNPSVETSKKVVSLPPPMVSERFSHQSYNQSRIPPFNPDILQTNYFPPVEIPQHDNQTSNHNFQNHNYNFTHKAAIPNNTVTVSSQNSQLHPSTNYIPLNSSTGFLPDLPGGNNYSSGIPDPPNFVFPPAATPLRNPMNRLPRPPLPYGASAANNQYHLAVRNDANQSTNRNVCNSARRMTGHNCLKQKNVRRRIPEPIVSTTISSAIPDLGYLPMPPGVNSAEDPSYGTYLPTPQQNPVIYSTSQNLLYPPRKVGNSSHNQLAAFAPAFGQQPARTGHPARNSQQATGSPNAANTTGTLTNFNLSTIFPEINDKHVPPASTFGTVSSKSSVPPPTVSIPPPPEAFAHTAPQVCRMQWS